MVARKIRKIANSTLKKVVVTVTTTLKVVVTVTIVTYKVAPMSEQLAD